MIVNGIGGTAGSPIVYTGPVNVPTGMTLEITGPNVDQFVEITELSSDVGSTINIEGGSVLTVNNDTALSLAGTISGSGSLAKTGDGILTISGTNSYSGGTTIGDGASSDAGIEITSDDEWVIMGVRG